MSRLRRHLSYASGIPAPSRPRHMRPARWLHRRHWGRRVSKGHGRTSIFKPHGSYYRHSGRIKLKAHKLGHCPHSRRLAYKKLSVKIPKKPGGPYGHWRSWSGSKTICKPPY